MKILNLIQCTNLGGMEQASLRLMQQLQAKGHTCQVLSLNPLGELKTHLEAAGIPAKGLPHKGKGGWRSFSALYREIQSAEADALLMTGQHLLSSLAIGGKWKGRRVLALHFQHGGVKPDWQWRLIYRVACARFDQITYPADLVRHEAEVLFAPVAKKACTIRCPIVMPEATTVEDRRSARRKLGIPTDAAVVGNAGWLIPRKRWDIFLQVAARVLAARPDVIFLAAGDGPEREALEEMALRLGIAGSIRWLGWQKELEPFYRAIDMLVFNSDWDVLAQTPQEAMSYGVPVVASQLHGGLGEIFRPGEDFVFLEQHDVEALAREALRLLDDAVARQKLGAAGRQRVAEVVAPEVIADSYEKLLLGNAP